MSSDFSLNIFIQRHIDLIVFPNRSIYQSQEPVVILQPSHEVF